MISIVVSHALLAVMIWLLATLTLKKNKRKIPNLQIHQEFTVCLSRDGEESKRKKNKKNKKKLKNAGQAQLIERLSERINNVENKEEEDSDKAMQMADEKKQKDFQATIQTYKQQLLIKPEQIEENIEKKSSRGIKIVHFQAQAKELEEEEEKTTRTIVKKQQDNQMMKALAIEELELIKNYFMEDLEQIVPYNGHYGKYKLSLQGSTKSILIEWTYHQRYPSEIVDINTSKEGLNLLELDKISLIFSQHREKSQKQANYFYIFNITTSIYQDCMIVINDLREQDKISGSQPHIQSQRQLECSEPDLNRQIQSSKNMLAMKEIHDEIFYLHDMYEKPDVSTLLKNQHEEVIKMRPQNTRGRYLAEFEEIQLIGEGGFGKVYKVKHKLDGNIYAIKKAIVNYEDLNDRKILKEVSLLSKLNHPNIVRYYQSWLEDASSIEEIISDMDYSEDTEKKGQLNSIYKQWKHNRSGGIIFESESERSYQGSLVENSGIMFEDNQDSDIAFENGAEELEISNNSSIDQKHFLDRHSSSSSMMNGMDIFPFKILYIAMQLCNGTNLREFINTRFDDEQQKIKILRGILEGLSYIHQKKIIHRDLKPANIFLTENNKVKIGDFGLAITEEKSVNISVQSASFDPLSDKTKAVGTGFYRAPEQLKSHKYNEKVDIYSLGIIMFELFYQFRTAMERTDVLKIITFNHELPRDFVVEKKGTDILESIVSSLKENPDERPSAAKLLESFRNKYFTQLVSCIANPKHFQFSELLKQLFDIKNEAVIPLLWRDYFKHYAVDKIERIYKIHRASLFPTLPLVPVQDFVTLNGVRIKTNRDQKYLLITNRGVVLEYTSNCLKTWFKYARQDFRRKKFLSLQQQRSSIRRYTFEKVVEWQPPKNNQDLYHHQKMITAFDLAYKLDEGFNAFYLGEVLKISESITMTLHLTQRRPPIYICHSHIYSLLAEKYKIQKNSFFGALLSIINENEFNSLPRGKRIHFFEQKNLPLNFARLISEVFQRQFQTSHQLFAALKVEGMQNLRNIEYEIQQLIKVRERINSGNRLIWKLLIPRASCNGFIWEIGLIKGMTSIQDYGNNQEFCNYHIEMGLDPERQIADVSIWCIGEYLQEEMQKVLAQCWKHGLTAKWYDWQIGEREDSNSRHSLILKKKNDRVQIMLKHNEVRQRERESSFINIELFNWQVLKQAAINQIFQSFH